jgi:hypothetical protein
VKQPLISKEAKLNALTLGTANEYDFPTEAGKSYTFIIAK